MSQSFSTVPSYL